MPADRLKQHATQVNTALERILATRESHIPTQLWEAMRYSLMAGGKRIRPAMMMECHAACGGRADIMPAALSIECMHTYSLIHDDLPSMDDDDLRRGQATCHKRFDEATAILAGDALQALSFELLGEMKVGPELALELTRRLAVAGGAQGMVGGQILDVEAESVTVESVLEVERIHLHKTGTLLRYCCEAGALLACADEAHIDACSRYGKAVGLLFQIADDILDATATTDELGKQAGQDAARNKATYVSVLGLPAANELADEMLEMATTALEPLGGKGNRLRALARYVRERNQ